MVSKTNRKEVRKNKHKESVTVCLVSPASTFGCIQKQ